MSRRPIAVAGFIALLAAALRIAGINQQDAAEIRQFEKARDGLRVLMNQEGVFTDDQRAQLDTYLTTLQLSINYWQGARQNDRDLIALSRKNCAGAVTRAQWVLDSAEQIARVSINDVEASPRDIHGRLPYGPGNIILRVTQNDAHPGDLPGFAAARADAEVRLGPVQTTYISLTIPHPHPGTNRIPLRLTSANGAAVSIELMAEAPATGGLHVQVVDAGSQNVTPAVVGVYGRDQHVFVPDEAVAFDSGGFSYSGGRIRPNREVRYWPGTPNQRRVFFSSGEFTLNVPEGEYTVIVGKGMEYSPVVQKVEVKAGSTVTQKVAMQRWVDMPSRGWYSGDMHVHWARATEAANQPLLQWTRAEDVHVASVLRMGDARETYFEQYGFGLAGQVVSGNYALVPGQEDPRTNIIGHTLHLHLQEPVRDPERYYLFDRIFEQVTRQGGLNGYAHMQQPNALGFFVRRSMTLEVPRGNTDFFEICEFGNLGLETYYEFLNLGFPLSVAAGSDVPWGGTVGTSRVYAHVNGHFTPDAWFAAMKAGHTFVTTGPMLEFTVNGELPGSVIQAKRGDVLRIKAAAEGSPVQPGYLEIVAQGDVVHSVQKAQNRLEVEYTLPVRDSMWIAARCNGGHTSPVYVKVGDERFWKRSEVSFLVANRLRELDEVEELLRDGMSDSHRGNWDNAASLRGHGNELKQRIENARAIYKDLLAEANKEDVR